METHAKSTCIGHFSNLVAILEEICRAVLWLTVYPIETLLTTVSRIFVENQVLPLGCAGKYCAVRVEGGDSNSGGFWVRGQGEGTRLGQTK